MEKNINVSGTGNIVNVAEIISNVTNTINTNLEKSNVDKEILNLIADLKGQFETVAPKAEPSQIKKMGKNLERLSEEIAEEEPDKRWYDISLEGIREAAEAIGDIASPIIKTVVKLATLIP